MKNKFPSEGQTLMTVRRPVSFYILVVLIPLILFLVLAEAMARVLTPAQLLPAPPLAAIIDPSQSNPYIVKMRPYLYTHIPGSNYTQARSNFRVNYEINSLGFRGPEIPRPRPQGLKRLLVVGDSVTEGYGIEFSQTFAHLLGENLQGEGWEVVNVGVQGASPLYYAANLERYLSLQPEAILIVLYENDIFEDRVREIEYFELPVLDEANRLSGESKPADLLLFSRFYTVLHREWQKRRGSPIEPLVEQNRASWRTNQEQVALFRNSPQLVPLTFIDQQWQMSQPYLDEVVTRLYERGVKVFVANLSTRGVQPGSPYEGHARHLDDQISAWAGERGVPFLSLLPFLAQAYTEKPVSEIVIEGDGHPTAATHTMIEAALRPWLLQELQGEAP